MIDDIDTDSMEPFDEQKWIGAGLKYDTLKLPYFVLSELEKWTTPPEDFLHSANLPSPNIHVSDIIGKELPRISSEIPITRPETWFSHNTPTIYPSILLTRPIPTHLFLNSLGDLLGQAWLDGAKSLIDPRINNGQDRLPLWVITYWKHVSTLVEKQKKWKSTLGWLETRRGGQIVNTIKKD